MSLVIPTLRRHPVLEECIESFKGQYDELIVIDDKEPSLAYKINKGMRMAKGDYIVVSNDDVVAKEGDLRNLCIENQVVSPKVNGGVFKVFHAHMFCIPRNIYAEVGGFDETCPGVYHIDSDYWLRLIQSGHNPVISDHVDVWHKHPASTIKTLAPRDRDMGTSRQWFINKHGEHNLSKVGA